MSVNYNIFIFLGRVLFVLFLIASLVVLASLVFHGKITKEWFYVVFAFMSFPIFLTSFIRSIHRETFHLKIKNGSVLLIRPIIGSQRKIDFESVRGFSTSEIKFGIYWGISIFKSKSIYT